MREESETQRSQNPLHHSRRAITTTEVPPEEKGVWVPYQAPTPGNLFQDETP